MSVLKTERRQLETELTLLTKKQSKSAWYHKKKQGSHSSGASSTDNDQMITQVLNSPASSSDMPQSSRRHFSLSPSPVMNSPASSSDMPQSSRRHFSPSPSPWPENQSSVTPSPASSRFTTPSPIDVLLLHAAAFLLRCLPVNLNVHMMVTPLFYQKTTLQLISVHVNHFPLFLTPLYLSGGVSRLYVVPLPMLKSCQVVPLCQVTSIFSKASPAHFAGGACF